VSDLTIGLLGALLATNQPLAVSNLVQQQTGVSIAVVNPGDSVEQELQKLMEDDDAALAEVDQWIQTNNALVAAGAGESKEALNLRIRARLDAVRANYDSFLRRHPDSARGFLAYGSFLDDTGDEDAGKVQFENAAHVDPKNPAAWNNLANYYGENGALTNAFTDYARAIELAPAEPLYYHNLAVLVYLYRKDAREFYGIDEQQVFDKALALYRKAIQLDPENFELATDYAESYYGIRPLRTNDALVAWTNALNIARNEAEREGVFIHLARVKTVAGFYDEARKQLDAVTNSIYADLKNRMERNVVEREYAATNPSPAVAVSAGVSANVPARPAAEFTNTVDLSTNLILSPPSLRLMPPASP
jgi:tetratricopeptide (TPR) repeat protein